MIAVAILTTLQSAAMQAPELRFLAWAAVTLLGATVALTSLVGRMVWRRLDHLDTTVTNVRHDVEQMVESHERRMEERHDRLLSQMNTLMGKAQAVLSFVELNNPELFRDPRKAK